MKTCGTCGKTKPFSEFYKGERYKDGYRGQCKECTNAKSREYAQTEKGRDILREGVKKWSKNNKSQVQKYKRWWYYEGGGKEYHQEWKQTEHGKRIARDAVRRYKRSVKGQESARRYKESNPEKRKAKSVVAVAVKKGEIPHVSTQSCTRCGKQAEHYHHWSYDPEHWLDVLPVCRECHNKIHN